MPAPPPPEGREGGARRGHRVTGKHGVECRCGSRAVVMLPDRHEVQFRYWIGRYMHALLDATGPSCTSELDGKLFRNENCAVDAHS